MVRALGQAMREQAAAIHGEAADLLAAAEAVPWAGLAADAMRRVARDHAAVLTASAQAHERAAAALERHAREVDQVKSRIAAAERRVHQALGSLTAGASGLGGRVGHALAHADLPPPGHLGWLDVRVPRWLP